MKAKKEKRPTIYDIAAQLNIAPSSVSKALNDSPSVSEKVKKLVRQKADELNYRHNSQAASLRRGKSRIIGVVVPKINSSFFSTAISGMEEICTLHKHQLIICQTEESFAKEKQAIDTLITNNVDCIMISHSMDTKDTDHLREAIKHNIPLIQFDRVSSDIVSHQVINDNKTATYRATKRLIAQGYDRVAFFGGLFSMQVYNERKAGYLQAVQETGMMIPYDYVVETVLSQESGFKTAKRLLDSSVPPNAFLASSDYSALGALQAVTQHGLRVPDDVGIIGFSNEPFSEMIAPKLTTVDQDSRRMGIEAATIYFDSLQEPGLSTEPQYKVVPCSLIERETTR